VFRTIRRRLLQAIPLLFLISVLCFTLIQLAPYDAVDVLTTPNMRQETINAIKARNGLDKPGYIQYLYWVRNVATGDLGNSMVSHQSIAFELRQRLPATLCLVGPSYALAMLLAITLGLIAGGNKDRVVDKVIDGLCSVGTAMPSFWLAMLLVYFFGYTLKWFPILGMRTIGVDASTGDLLRHYVLPATVLTLSFLPELVRYVRSSTISQFAEEYVLVQRAFGASWAEILFRHVLKNVLLPIVTIAGMSLPMLVTGAVITESVFGWPGVGPYFIRAIQGFDYPIVMTILLFSSCLAIVGNLLADILYCVIDPRIRAMGR
jgi:peptide/nickel transport system permease protein